MVRFKLPRPIMDEAISQILTREVRRQKVYVVKATRQHLKQLSAVVQEISTRALPERFVRKKLPKGLGYGIFLHPKVPPIERGEIIASYSGEVVFVPQHLANDSLYAFEPLCDITLSKQEQTRFDPKRKYHPRRAYSVHVDAAKTGNFTRFINHSDKPNLVAKFFKISPNTYGLPPTPIEVVYVAHKRILPGEQLLVSYEGDEPSYWTAIDVQPLPITPQTFQLDQSLKVRGSLPRG